MPHRPARAARWFPLALLLAMPTTTGQPNAPAGAGSPPAAGLAATPVMLAQSAVAQAGVAAPGRGAPAAAGDHAVARLPEAAPGDGAIIRAALTAPDASVPEAPPAPRRVSVIVQRGDTLARILADAGVAMAEAAPALAALTEVFPARGLQPGQALALGFDGPGEPGRLVALDLEAEPGRRVAAAVGATGAWTAAEEETEGLRHLVLARGEVRGALITSLQNAGLPPPLAVGLVRLLAHEVDFERDLHPGDRFTILFERFRDAGGGLLREGEIVHLDLFLAGRRIALWRHETEAGEADWYDAEGRSLRRAFLRTPLDGARLTSSFGMRRHPILGFTRMHHGVDFAAPRGTPVYAAADGEVVEARSLRGYGRTVRLRHAGGAETLYAHLSRFTPGLRPGRRVRQGEVIGQVGSTGLSTGPHLHYEVHLAGEPVDPAGVPSAARARLAGRALQAFLRDRDALRTQLARLAPKEEVAWAE